MSSRVTSNLATMEDLGGTTSEVHLALVHALLAATDTPAVAAALSKGAQALPGCRDATVVWSLSWPGERHSHPQATLSTDRLLLAESAITSPDRIAHSPTGGDCAIALHADPDGATAVLICRLDEGAADRIGSKSWREFLAPARARAATALETERLKDSLLRLEKAERLQRALFAIADMAGSDLDMPEMLRGLHRIVSGLMYAENFYIALYDPGRDALRFIYFVDRADPDIPDPNEYVPLARIERGLTWYLIRDRRPLMGPTYAMRRQISGPLKVIGTDCKDWLGVPMLRGSEVHGALVVQTYVDGIQYTPEDQALLAFVANHVLTALERKLGQEELEHRVAQRTEDLARANAELVLEVEQRQRGERLQAALYRIAELSGSDGSMEEFFAAIHGIVGVLLNAENFYVALLSEDGAELVFPYHVDEIETRPAPRPLGNGATEYVLRTGKPLLVDGREIRRMEAAGQLQMRGALSASWLGVPLIGSEGVIGAVVVQSYHPGTRYGARDQELLTFVSHHVANSLERRRAAEGLREANALLEQRVEERTRELREQIAERELIELKLKHQVMHDALTGLPNRSCLRDRIDLALARLRRHPERVFAVLFLDLDRFKVINDSLGHQAGDAVLKESAQRLAACVREPDTVARLGGDEFAILMEDFDGAADAELVAQRVIQALSLPMRAADKEVLTSASVGIAFGDRTYRSADDLLRDADIAMYRAKSRGRHCYELFDRRLHREVVDTLDLETELRAGLDSGAFEPFLQPLRALAGGAIAGFEALLRWHHPTRGLLAPGEFLRVAEDSGLIEAIDWRVFELACRAAAALPEPGQFITVNVSPRHFTHADFDWRLLELIDACGIGPERICIELTEGSLLTNTEQVRAILGRLREAGVLAALDDFGTGYSSLSYLHRFPLRMLKIDRSFIAELGDGPNSASAGCVKAILALARSLEMEVVAEGIETAAQHEALLALGCELGQGYLLGRPLPIAHWLDHAGLAARTL